MICWKLYVFLKVFDYIQKKKKMYGTQFYYNGKHSLSCVLHLISACLISSRNEIIVWEKAVTWVPATLTWRVEGFSLWGGERSQRTELNFWPSSM